MSHRYPYTPGHPQAVHDGCKCPIVENGRGKGIGWVDSEGRLLFSVHPECALHTGAPQMQPGEECFTAEDYAAAQLAVAKLALEERAK